MSHLITPLEIENNNVLKGWMKNFCQSESIARIGIGIGSKGQYTVMAPPEYTPEHLIRELQNVVLSLEAHQEQNKS